MRDLKGLVKTTYGNPLYVKDTCQTPIPDTGFNTSSESCLNILFSGQCESAVVVVAPRSGFTNTLAAYHSLIAFMYA